MTILLDADVPGLDLVLGGGIRALTRVEGAAESTTLLIRGPAGSGKTLLGTQLAASIARGLDSDVAYGCVELLPVELRAQHRAIRGAEFKEQVVPLGADADASAPDDSFVRIYAGLLDLGEEGQAVERLGDALEALLEAANEHGPIRVLVVDSLSDGYGLGSHAPRLLADGISKLAADEGLIVILLEETVDERPSVWSFAVDTVLELGWADAGGRLQRKLWIPKNRLGPMVPGPHPLLISSGEGVRIHPHPEAYRRGLALLQWAEPVVPATVKQPWALKGLDDLRWLPPFRSCVTAVVGTHANYVRRFALGVGAGSVQAPLDSLLGGDLFFRIGRMGGHEAPPQPGRQLGLSFLNDGASFLSMLRQLLEVLHKAGKSPRRVVLGDLRDLRYHAHAQDIVSAISVAASLLRGLQIPLVLFDTLESFGSSSVALSLADVSITWGWGEPAIQVENLLTGQDDSVYGGPQDLILAK